MQFIMKTASAIVRKDILATDIFWLNLVQKILKNCLRIKKQSRTNFDAIHKIIYYLAENNT